MRDQPTADPLFDVLSGLAPLAPREFHDRRVRRRCHEVLAHRRARHAPPAPRTRLADILVVGAVAFYVIAVISEAIRLLGVAG